MDVHEKRLVGEEIEPGGREKAPGRLELLQRFVNTHNHEFPADWDRIGNGAKATAWLREKGLIEPEADVSDGGAARLRALREAVRKLMVANRGGAPDPAALAVIRGAESSVSVAIDDAGVTSLESRHPEAALLAILHEAQLRGDWPRMKACRQCEYAFFDRSKNRSATWCSMAICGNRTKNRAYYRRKRGAQ
jgi:predicted RNA-binding Zn ribbon-like protein